MKTASQCQLILVLDLESEEQVFALLDRVGTSVKWVKVGLQLFLRYGPDLVHRISEKGYQVFLDLKLHDIPNTVASAIQNLKGLPVGMLTLHAAGGQQMMEWAKGAQAEALPNTVLLAVTVLTSMDQHSLNAIGCAATAEEQVIRLGKLAITSGLEGLVCSPEELRVLRRELGDAPTLVTPGIRPQGAAQDDQKRTLTPAEAAIAGSSFIVVGRPILKAKDPLQATQALLGELNASHHA